MAISIDHLTRIIFVPKVDLTLVSGVLYEYDVDVFRLELKSYEDSSNGMPLPDTHQHNSEVTISGVTYARTFELINGFTVEIEDGQYTVSFTGANHNLADERVQNQVSFVINNAAGLISGSPSDNANGLLDLTDGVESDLTVRETLRIIVAAVAGELSGAEGTNIKIRNINDSKDRIDATVDVDGNRTAVVLDKT